MKHFDDKKIGDMTFSEFYNLWKLAVEQDDKIKQRKETISKSINHYMGLGFQFDEATSLAEMDADGIFDPIQRMKILKEKK